MKVKQGLQQQNGFGESGIIRVYHTPISSPPLRFMPGIAVHNHPSQTGEHR